MSNDTKWIVGMIVASVVATGIGVAAVMFVVAIPQLSHMAAHVRDHEKRVKASNNDVILELHWLFDGMRDDYRERMHGVEEVLRELRAIRQRLDTPEESAVDRALSRVERVLSGLLHSRPVRAHHVAHRLREVRNELREMYSFSGVGLGKLQFCPCTTFHNMA